MKKYYDFKKVRDMKERLIIINGIMNDGKTFGAKLDMLEQFKKDRSRAVWVMNSDKMLQEEMEKFATDLCEYNDEWENFKVKKVNRDLSIGYFNEEIMVYFQNINSSTKTARDSKIRTIYYDEFNYGTTRIWNVQYKNFMVLLSRNMDNLRKIFLIGNATSLNVPLLYNLNVWQIKDEWTKFPLTKKENFVFHNFKRPLEEIEERYNESLSYAIMSKGDFVKHAFMNEYLLDNSDNVIKIDKWSDFENITSHKWYYTFKLTNEIFIDVYCFWYNNDLGMRKVGWYVGLAKDKKKEKYGLTPDLISDGIYLRDDITRNIAKQFQSNHLFYENITIKQNLYKVIFSKIRNIF